MRADGTTQIEHDRDNSPLSVLSFAKYERAHQDDNYRRRMTMNGLALIWVAALVAIGVWLADNIT